MSYSQNDNNVINFPFIDYIIKSYIPQLQLDKSYQHVNIKLFQDAMMHNSAAKNNQRSYERLEYLGDAIFHMVITEYLYKRYDEETKGFLTKLRIRIEKGDSMTELCKILKIDQFIQINYITVNEHILEDVFEAFIGVFYLNFGMEYIKLFIIKLIEKHKNLSELIFYDDNYKDILLRYFHQRKWGNPIYQNSKSPDESTSNCFVSHVKNPFGKKIGTGTGNSKRKAEQIASKTALIRLGVINNNEIDWEWFDKIERIEKDDKEKDRKDKKPLIISNINNKLIKKKDVLNFLKQYHIRIPNESLNNIKLFHEAMTHRSYTVRKKKSNEMEPIEKGAVKLQNKSNERLQFLGDAVIHFVIGEFIFKKYLTADEGFMTRLRCKLENSESLYFLSKQIGIDSFLLISRNIETLHGRNNINIIGGGFEAFIGALYLEIGLNPTKQFILEIIREELNIDEIADNETNYKDLILQLYNQKHWGKPEYRIIKEQGPDHCKIFTMGIYLHDKLMGQGKASSKRKAEQIASKIMYQNYLNVQS